MNIENVVAELRAERDRLDAAIVALEGGQVRPARRGRRGRMSASARARIAAAMRARWAARKDTSPATGKVRTAAKRRGRRGMSPAARKRMSEMMKARWAARRKSAKS